MSSKFRSLAKSQKAVLETPFLEQLGEQPIQLVIDNQIQAILFRVGEQLTFDIVQSLKDKELDASGFLISSVDGTDVTQQENNNYSLKIKMADYWEAVETGRRDGKMPPVENIMLWIANKGLISKRTTKGGSTIKANRKMAWGIAKNIAKKGTIKRFNYKGSKFLSDVVNDEAMRDISLMIGESLGKTVAVNVAVAFNPQYNKF
jgi:hypothetical protein